MSRKDGILDLVVKADPFRDLKSGAKPEEYREGSFHWARKLLVDEAVAYLLEYREGVESVNSGHIYPYHTARISLGYAPNRESFLRPIRLIRWGVPNPAWTYGIIAPKPCFVIELEAP